MHVDVAEHASIRASMRMVSGSSGRRVVPESSSPENPFRATVMAAIFTIRLPSGVSFEAKLPHGKPLAEEVKTGHQGGTGNSCA